jgi:hypothetical protein
MLIKDLPMTNCTRLSAAFAAVFLVASVNAYGQAAGTATPNVTPAPNCEKPGNPPSIGSSELGKSAAAEKQKKWTTGMREYLECVKAFVEHEQAAAAPHIRAANAAVDEYSKSMKVYNDYVDLLKQ